MSIVYVYVGFWTDHYRIETRVDKNQLVHVKKRTFYAGCPCLIIPITGFSINLASNHCVISKILLSISHLLGPPKQFVPEPSIFTTIIHNLCSISNAYSSQFSTFSSIFSYLAPGSFPLHPTLIHQILQRALGRLRMIHTTSVLVPHDSSVFRLFPNRNRPKTGESWLSLFFWGGGGRAGFPCITTSPGPRPIPRYQVAS